MGLSIEKVLERETLKWTEKLEERIKHLRITNKSDVKDIIENIRAYIKDSQHFLMKKDFVNAYEAIIYAWGLYDALRKLNLIE